MNQAPCSDETRLLAGSRSPLGFMLIELLVVIAIIGILAALLLPASNADKLPITGTSSGSRNI